MLGPDHPEVSASLMNFAMLQSSLGKNREAEADSCLAQSMLIHNQLSGGTSLNAVFAANHLADVRTEQSQFEEADTLLNKSLQVRESKLPPEHPHLALSLHSLGRLRARQGLSADAERYYKRALAIRAAALPLQHPHRAKLLEDFAALFTLSGRSAEAAGYAGQAHAARENTPLTKLQRSDSALSSQSRDRLRVFIDRPGVPPLFCFAMNFTAHTHRHHHDHGHSPRALGCR
jgi:tetratricopeptide (TPR) repeat protein